MVTGEFPSFASLLRRYRTAAGLTQEMLAERAALSAVTVSSLERGVNHTPRRDTVERLAGALGLAPAERALLEAAGRTAGMAVQQSPVPTGGHRPVVPTLVGRSGELALLDRQLAAAPAGVPPPLLLFAGEPGIGKSRLLQEAVARAPGQGWRVLHGGCQRRGGQEPYAPLLGALERHLGRLQPAQRRGDLQGCAWLVRLLPELAGTASEELPATPLAPEQERRLLFGAVGRFLTNVAGPSGTLLLLDDLQWAGGDALDLLGTLVRADATAPLRVIGAYRDSEVGPRDPLSVLAADLAHAGLVTHHALGPLSGEEVGHLLAEAWPNTEAPDVAALGERVRQRAGGVPFFVLSCVQALRTQQRDGQDVDAVPWSVVQSVRQRVAALPDAAQDVLGTAAVAGRHAPAPLLTRIARRPEHEVLAALDAVVRARLLVEEEHAYRFAHDVIREVVEADLGAARRMALHRRVAEALKRQHGRPPAALLAYHYGHSDVPEQAIPYLEQAGDEARDQHARTAAAGYYQELVERLERGGRTTEAARVREKQGHVLYRDGRYAEALAVLEGAADAYRVAGDLDRLGQVMGLIGLIHIDQGTFGEATERLLALLAPLRAGGTRRGLAAVCLALSDLLAHAGRAEEALEVTQTAVEIAEALGDGAMRADGLMRRCCVLGYLERPAEALADAEQAMRGAEAAGDFVTLFWARQEAIQIHGWGGDLARWREESKQHLAEAERFGDPVLIIAALHERAILAEIAGDWGQARQDRERTLATMHQMGGQTWLLAPSLVLLGRLCLKEGDHTVARRFLAESEALGTQISSPATACELQGVLAHCDLLDGQPAAALARLVPDPPIHYSISQLTQFATYLVLRAWALLETVALAQAEREAKRAVARERALNNRISLVEGLWVQARVALRRESEGEAARALGEALSLARGMPYPHGEARLLQVQAELHTRRGESGHAREHLEEALAIYRRLGARGDAMGVECALA
jgi:tetratricopeptide (TPR) repeat protein/transcriptional regulator with XRE-family HTH domain